MGKPNKPVVLQKTTPRQKLVGYKVWYLSHKKRSIPASILLLLILVSAIPVTRYALPSLLVKKDISIIITDTVTGEVVPDAEVTLGKKIYKTDATGLVAIKNERVGYKTALVTKVFYETKELKFTVTPFGQQKQKQLQLKAAGRLVKVTVKNRLNGVAMKDITIAAEKGGAAKTNDKGEATLVIPTGATESTATLSADSIIETKVTIRAVQDTITNVFPVTPVGKIYFISKASGKLDVIKTNLDGTDRTVALPATGSEKLGDTALLPSPNWKYLLLKAERDQGKPALYIIDTSTDEITKIADNAGYVTAIGWVNDTFYYREETDLALWQTDRSFIKSYSLKTKNVSVVDKTKAEGYGYYDYAGESFGDVYMTPSSLIYTKYWSASYYYGSRLADKQITVNQLNNPNDQIKVIKQWQAGYNSFIRSVQSGPSKFYYYVQLDGVQNSFWQYENGVFEASNNVGPEAFNNTQYPSFASSPSGNMSLWAEQRDGKNALFIGDDKAENQKQIATLTEYYPYGWYGEDYILLTKELSELYIIGRDGIKPGDAPIKISDYYRPEYNYGGYGGYY